VLVVSVPILFIVLATIPFIRTSGGRDQAGGVVTAFTNAIASPLEEWNTFMTSYDTDMVGSLSVEVGVLRVPDDLFYGGATFGDLLVAPIPSSLYPDKPTTARNQMLIMAYGTPCTLTAGGLCPDFSAIGTFYQDLAWPGVLLGMAMLGVLSRALWARHIADPGSATRVIAVATWWVIAPIMIRAGVMPALAWWLYFLLPSLLIVGLARAMTTRLSHPGTVLLQDAPSATSPARGDGGAIIGMEG
jgi:hypothetical protein